MLKGHSFGAIFFTGLLLAIAAVASAQPTLSEDAQRALALAWDVVQSEESETQPPSPLVVIPPIFLNLSSPSASNYISPPPEPAVTASQRPDQASIPTPPPSLPLVLAPTAEEAAAIAAAQKAAETLSTARSVAVSSRTKSTGPVDCTGADGKPPTYSLIMHLHMHAGLKQALQLTNLRKTPSLEPQALVLSPFPAACLPQQLVQPQTPLQYPSASPIRLSKQPPIL
jgi:hypothetical protein